MTLLQQLRAFVRESNRIEGIMRPPTAREMHAHHRFIGIEPYLTVEDLERFVDAVAPDHELRRDRGLNVRVGDYVAPMGGPEIEERLSQIVGQANTLIEPFQLHQRYESLHPFTDGNGRSGRVLWLWMMLKAGRDPYALSRGFLHTYYYQSLSAAR